MESHLRYYRCVFALVIAVVMLFATGPSKADSIDLSLNLLYNDQFNPNSGGTWQLAAKSGGEGILGLVALIEGIDPGSAQLAGPSGTMNGSDAAGFSLNVADFGTHFSVVLSQMPLGTGVGEETVFYGVGSIVDPDGGAPNYAGQPANTTSRGPNLASLTNVSNEIWGNGDPLGEAEWDSAAILATGTFDPGVTPSFFSGDSTGSVFSAVPPNSSQLGTFDSQVVASTTVRSDLMALLGDFNQDGIIDLADYTLWRNALGETVTPPGTGIDADGSGTVDEGDFLIWRANYGAGSTTPGPVSSNLTSVVPEPGAGLLMLVLACILLVYRHIAGQSQDGCKSFLLNSLNT